MGPSVNAGGLFSVWVCKLISATKFLVVVKPYKQQIKRVRHSPWRYGSLVAPFGSVFSMSMGPTRSTLVTRRSHLSHTDFGALIFNFPEGFSFPFPNCSKQLETSPSLRFRASTKSLPASVKATERVVLWSSNKPKRCSKDFTCRLTAALETSSTSAALVKCLAPFFSTTYFGVL